MDKSRDWNKNGDVEVGGGLVDWIRNTHVGGKIHLLQIPGHIYSLQEFIFVPQFTYFICIT